MNIDHRLDFFNAARDYVKQANDEEAFMIVSLSDNKSNLIISISDDNDVFSAIAANENNWLNLNEQTRIDAHEKLQSVVLDMALNILYNKPEIIQSFISALANPQTI